MGTSQDNWEEVLRTNEKKNEVCGVKIFMGSSTGNLLVDNPLVLEKIFEGSELLIATHCEEESIIKKIRQHWKQLNPSLNPPTILLSATKKLVLNPPSKRFN